MPFRSVPLMFHVKHRSNGVDAVQIAVTIPHLTPPAKIPLHGTAYTGAMAVTKANSGGRLAASDVVRVDAFTPWWVKCPRCSGLAHMTPNWSERKGESKCVHCGAVYSVPLSADYRRVYPELALCFRAEFRDEVFWALNGEDLAHLELVIRATLRERQVLGPASGKFRERGTTNQNMPFNLPAWLLSAKNRPDLLRLPAKLRKTVPQ
jgi:hypothetical protein